MKIQDFMDKSNFFFGTLPLSPWALFSYVIECRSSKHIWKMNFQTILNKNLPHVHMDLEFDVLDVAKKLVKYVVHLSKRKIWKYIYISFHRVPKQRMTNFWSEGILEVKLWCIGQEGALFILWFFILDFESLKAMNCSNWLQACSSTTSFNIIHYIFVTH
jgi:hypothetical protein